MKRLSIYNRIVSNERVKKILNEILFFYQEQINVFLYFFSWHFTLFSMINSAQTLNLESRNHSCSGLFCNFRTPKLYKITCRLQNSSMQNNPPQTVGDNQTILAYWNFENKNFYSELFFDRREILNPLTSGRFLALTLEKQWCEKWSMLKFRNFQNLQADDRLFIS